MSRIFDSDEFMDTWWAWVSLGFVAMFMFGFCCATGAVALAILGLVVAFVCLLTAGRIHRDHVEDVRRRAVSAARFRRGLP